MEQIKSIFSFIFTMIDWKRLALILAVLIFILFGYISALKLWNYFDTESVVEEETITLQGTLYASLAKYTEPVGIFSLDLSGTEISNTFQPLINYSSATTMQLHTTEDEGNGSALLYVTVVPEIEGDKLSSNIISILPDGTLDSLLPDDNDLVQIQHLSYSLASDWLVFSAKSSSVLDNNKPQKPLSVGARSIYVVSPVTKKVYYIAPGSSPVWSPDGASIVFLAENGIKQFHLGDATKDEYVEEVEFAGEGTTFGENMNLAVSDDGSMVAISSPNQHSLFVGKVSDWNTFAISDMFSITARKGELTKAYYWPVFSPDGKFLAVQVSDVVGQGVQKNPRVDIFNVADKSIMQTISLDEFDFSRAFIDEWDY